MYLRNFEFGCQDYSEFSLRKFACIIPEVKVKGKLSNMVQVTDIVNLTSLFFKEFEKFRLQSQNFYWWHKALSKNPNKVCDCSIPLQY